MIPSTFRKTFQIVNKDLIQWYPGHMNKGIKQMQNKLNSVDLVIEVHDARIPLSGRNPDFKYTVSGVKPHILVLNKKDLGDKSSYDRIAEKIKKEQAIDQVVYTNCKDQQCEGVKSLLDIAINMISGSNRYNRKNSEDYCCMIIGVPNVGKSSIINVLRNRHVRRKKGSPVGAVAGITRSVLNKIKISEDPLIYMLDTPGILTPNIVDTETGLKLALCSCLPDHIVGPELIADFLLFWMNKNGYDDYVKYMNVERATDSIGEVLLAGSKLLKKTIKLRDPFGQYIVKPDFEASAYHFIKGFRMGALGKHNLDVEFF